MRLAALLLLTLSCSAEPEKPEMQVTPNTDRVRLAPPAGIGVGRGGNLWTKPVGAIPLNGTWDGGFYDSINLAGADNSELLAWPPLSGSVIATGSPGTAPLLRTNSWPGGGPCVEFPAAGNRRMFLNALASMQQGDDLPVSVFAAIVPRASNGTVIAFTTNAVTPYHTCDFNATIRTRIRRDDGGGVTSIAAPPPSVNLNARALYTWIFNGTQGLWSTDEMLVGPTACNEGPLAAITQVVLGNLFQVAPSTPLNAFVRGFGIRSTPFTQTDIDELYDYFFLPRGNIWQFDSSIVAGTGSSDQSGWRRPLWVSIIQAGYKTEFVGSGIDPSFTFAHPKRDGISGITLTQIRANVQAVFGPGLAVPSARLILMLAGIGNMGGLYTPVIPAEYRTLLEEIYDISPTTRIAVTTLPPQDAATRPIEAANVPLFNADLPAEWDDFDAAHPSVPLIRVDLNTAIGGPAFVGANFSDDVHPNNTGYNLIAAEWFSGISAFLATW